MSENNSIQEPKRFRINLSSLKEIPWWVVILVVIGVAFLILVLTDKNYQETMLILIKGRPTASALEGLLLTVRITLVSFAIAMTIGLFTGLARVSKNVILNNLATFYVEVIRGMPLVVLMLYVAFVILPIFVNSLNGLGESLNLSGLADLSLRDISFESRAIAALAIGFGAYEAEVFRAGIVSIERGQMEAARSLGMNYIQAMRYVILPQAIRRVLPPLGNDFIALLKDSSLATVLAVPELTQLGRVQRSSTFRVFEVFNSVAFLYLSMTLVLSFLVRLLERRLSSDSRDEAIR
ncbi:MAG TPA: amino acid ABC transporter permease [Anaerolineales bacterium]|jgi:polar amino acid transport system permease protein|nr:amino acid ABC transporter permease [Anaerolineales bacterium]